MTALAESTTGDLLDTWIANMDVHHVGYSAPFCGAAAEVTPECAGVRYGGQAICPNCGRPTCPRCAQLAALDRAAKDPA